MVLPSAGKGLSLSLSREKEIKNQGLRSPGFFCSKLYDCLYFFIVILSGRNYPFFLAFHHEIETAVAQLFNILNEFAVNNGRFMYPDKVFRKFGFQIR